MHAHEYYPANLWENNQYVTLPRNLNASKKYCGPNSLRTHCDWSQDMFVNKSVEFMRRQKQPFYLYVAFTTPHAGRTQSSSFLWRSYGRRSSKTFPTTNLPHPDLPPTPFSSRPAHLVHPTPTRTLLPYPPYPNSFPDIDHWVIFTPPQTVVYPSSPGGI